MNSSNAASIIVSDPNLTEFITSEAPENLRADIWIETIAEKSDLLPHRVNATDAGADLRANHNFMLRPGERKTVTTGVRVDIPAGFMGLIYGRSGLANSKGIDVLGGVIDAGFQGELSVVLVNTSSEEWTFAGGDRIAQLLIMPIITPAFIPVSQFSEETARGTNGFGSTGA